MSNTIDDLLVLLLGQFGKYQKILFLITCLAAAFCGQPIVVLPFVSYLPKYRCFIKGCDDPESPVYNENFLNFTIPDNKHLNIIKLEKCAMYQKLPNYTNLNYNSEKSVCSADRFDLDITTNCHEWVYDNQEYGIHSITQEYNLTCSNEWLSSLGGSSYMIGMLIGAVSIGALSDKFGRKPGFIVSLIFMIAGGLGCAFSVNYTMFIIMRFLTGAGHVGLYQAAYIIAIEFVGPKHRTYCGILIAIPFALGEASVGVLAYFIPEWRWLILAVCIPSFTLVFFLGYLPESFRWLIVNGQTQQAIDVLKKAAKVNNSSLSDCFIQDSVYEKIEDDLIDYEDGSTKTIIDFFRTPNMRKKTLVLIFTWMVCSLVYYGLSSNVGNLGGNIYVNFIATMLIEIPSYIFSILVLDRMGRKGTLSFVMTLGGISCILCGVIEEEEKSLMIFLSLIGKFGLAAAFNIIYLYTAELYPTDYRSVGIGACSTCSRVSSAFSPVISTLGIWYKPLPFMIFGGLSVISGGLLIFLPETVGCHLPQSLQESEKFGKDQDICYFTCLKKRNTSNEYTLTTENSEYGHAECSS